MTVSFSKPGVALVSVVSNAALVASKLLIGFLIGSVSVISEAIHSGVDLLAAVIAFLAVRGSGKPSDKEHSYGHGKIENISGAIEALLIFLAAGWIIYEAVKKLIHQEPLDNPGWGIVVMLGSAVVNAFVSALLFKVAGQTRSIALEADAWHLRTDVYTSLGVMVGLSLIWVSERAFQGIHFHWIDPAAAILVAAMIIKAAYHLTRRAMGDLLDSSLPDDEVDSIRECALSYGEPVCGCHRLKTRRSGERRLVEFHLLVQKDLTVETSHRISEAITSRILERFPGTSVTIHVEPEGDAED